MPILQHTLKTFSKVVFYAVIYLAFTISCRHILHMESPPLFLSIICFFSFFYVIFHILFSKYLSFSFFHQLCSCKSFHTIIRSVHLVSSPSLLIFISPRQTSMTNATQLLLYTRCQLTNNQLLKLKYRHMDQFLIQIAWFHDHFSLIPICVQSQIGWEAVND